MDSQSVITLLIVDDEAEIRSGLRAIIPWENYSVSVIGTAVNGAEALAKIRYYEPDIVITDIQMPGMNGLDLVRRSREEQFDCSFVILSGYDDFEYARTAIKYGVEDYLLKPISIKELTGLIGNLRENILHKRSLHTDRLYTLHRLRSAEISLKRQNLIPQLLRGEFTSEQLHDTFEEYGLNIKDTESCAVLIQAFGSRFDTENYGELSQSLMALKKLLESELEGTPSLISEISPAGLILAVNLPFKLHGLESLSDMLSRCLSVRHCGSLTAAMGKPVHSLSDLSLSYQNARQAMTWRIYPDTGPVIKPEVTDRPQPQIVMPDDGILQAVLRDNTENVCRRFRDYFDCLITNPLPPPSYLYGMCNYLIITIQSQLSEYLGEPPVSFTGNSYAVLSGLSSLDEIRSWMCEILLSFSNELSVSRATKSDPLIEKAIAYIHANLLKNPHTEEVCSYLGLSKSYFSTYFKNKTKLNFRDYLLNLKISYAQKQLKHPNTTAGDVALLLGYEDYRSFSRAFKARAGLTPSDYQSQYANDRRS